jgi:hypothetical protein
MNEWNAASPKGWLKRHKKKAQSEQRTTRWRVLLDGRKIPEAATRLGGG